MVTYHEMAGLVLGCLGGNYENIYPHVGIKPCVVFPKRLSDYDWGGVEAMIYLDD